MVEWLSASGYILVLATVLGCVAAVLLWWLYNKNRFRFDFELYSRDMKSSTSVKGRIKTDESNKKYRYFAFKNTDSRLEIKEPDFFKNGKPIRRITYDTTGEYIYVEGVEVDNKDYLKYRLKPEHKTLYLQGLKDYANKYSLVNKAMLVTFAGIIILGVFLTVGFIYTFASNIKQGEQLMSISKTNGEVVDGIGTSVKGIEAASNTIYQAISYMYNGTLTRSLPSNAVE